MGSKYEFKADQNPAVGQYDVDTSQTMGQSKSAIIKTATSPQRRPKEREPEPGQYNAATHKSWTNEYLKDKKVTLGSKY